MFTLTMPPIDRMSDGPRRYYWKAFRAMAAAAGGSVDTCDRLVVWHSHCQVVVDGKTCVYDYSDFPTVPAEAADYPNRWIKRMYTPMHATCYRGVTCGADVSFLDWEPYKALRVLRSEAGAAILHRQHIPDGSSPVAVDLRRRRSLTRELLLARFGSRVDTHLTQQGQFFADALRCLVSIHIPGSWRHSLDRGQAQLMALGVPTISPEIFTLSCGQRPEPGIHYLRLRDDYSNVCRLIEWCDWHRQEAESIGRAGAEWFERTNAPRAVWNYLLERIR